MFRYTKATAFREALVWVVTLLTLLPFYFLVTTAFKTDSEVFTTNPVAPPAAPSFDNFATVLAATDQRSLAAGLLNSVIITGGSIIGLILFGSLAAYVIARRTQWWSNLSYYLFLIAIILPTQLGIVPLYVGARLAGLTGSPWGMIVIYVGSLMPLAVFLYAGFFRGLPRDYEEAATIDGARPGQLFFRVVLPLMAPATGTVAILAGLIVWNDFFTSLIFLSGSGSPTLPVAMYTYVGSLVSQWNQIFAIVIISMIPILAFYLFAQKRFIQGFAGGLKS